MQPKHTQRTPAAWGKLKIDRATGNVQAWLPLVSHCLDVAMVFRKLIDLSVMRARLNEACGQKLTNAQCDRLAVIAFLHDLGKCNQGFQAKSDPAATKSAAGHIMEAVALLTEPKLRGIWTSLWWALIKAIESWFSDGEQAFQMLIASISHHGWPVSESDYDAWRSGQRDCSIPWSPSNDYDPMRALEEIAQTVRKAFPLAFSSEDAPMNASPSLQQRFAGLVMLADWIASDTKFFPYDQDIDGRLEFARKKAQDALRIIGLLPPQDRAPKPFATVFPFELTPLQDALAHTLDVNEDARLVLAESDTGSGKTEAALVWFFRLYAEGRVDGLYFALPTRVAARELYERVHEYVQKAFEEEYRPSPVLLAVPGYVKVDGEELPHLPDPVGTLWDDDEKAQAYERFWSAEHPKRFLAAPIAVGTIDQALLSALQVKHSFMRSVCLDRSLLVVDEVHASDTYMREVLKALLRGHLKRGGWALLLSATLGEVAAAEFFNREAVNLGAAIKRPYPLISSTGASHIMPKSRPRKIAVELSATLTDDEALLPKLLAALQEGARVLVVCNTVGRTNTLLRKVEDKIEAEAPKLLSAIFSVGSMRCPHHGRFAREDRLLLDREVTAQFGKGSPDGGRLLIGTQTLEQSLDIDADWLITDLAPMDVLIQRLGRLHRHKRSRPKGFENPRVLVRVPEKALSDYLNEKGELRAPAGLGGVYTDGRVLAATWAQLQQHHEIVLPEHARYLIEYTTHPEALQGLSEKWRVHEQNWLGRQLSEITQAIRSTLDEKPFWELHSSDKAEHIRTRLGEQMIEIPLAQPMRSPFGRTIQRVSIPARKLGGEKIPEMINAQASDFGFRFTIGKKNFCYTRFGLEEEDAQSA